MKMVLQQIVACVNKQLDLQCSMQTQHSHSLPLQTFSP